MDASWRIRIGTGIAGALALTTLLLHGVVLGSQSADSVGGLVVGLDGTPLAGVQVRVRAEGANKATPSVAVTETDGSGQYLLENIPPGTYVVSAGPNDEQVTATAFRVSAIIMDVFNTTIKMVYSPVLSGPASVTIPRATNVGVNIVLLPSAVKITGRIALIPSMPFPSQLRVTLLGTVPTPLAAEAEVQNDGTFEFFRIPPGAYVLRLNPNLGVSPLNVIVADQDLTGVEFGGISAA